MPGEEEVMVCPDRQRDIQGERKEGKSIDDREVEGGKGTGRMRGIDGGREGRRCAVVCKGPPFAVDDAHKKL